MKIKGLSKSLPFELMNGGWLKYRRGEPLICQMFNSLSDICNADSV